MVGLGLQLCRLTSELSDPVSTGHVPDAQRLVGAGCVEVVAVGREAQLHHSPRVAGEGSKVVALAVRVPEHCRQGRCARVSAPNPRVLSGGRHPSKRNFQLTPVLFFIKFSTHFSSGAFSAQFNNHAGIIILVYINSSQIW